jgi:pSer/pThr/pTyr-binding forkhead associated (FHA) protein
MVDKSVGEATASPIFLLDDQQISRVHAYVTINAGVVLVRDAGTPGGTFVASPGDREWTSVGDQPTELKPGSTLRIGERMLVYRN